MNSAINDLAIKCAWPPGTSVGKYKYHGGKPTDTYKKVIKSVFGNSHLSHQRKVGCSCDVFPSAIVRYLGIDKSFPSGLGEQKPYLSRSNKWKRVSNKNA